MSKSIDKLSDLKIDEKHKKFDFYKSKIKEAYKFSLRSKHPTTKVGVVLYKKNKRIDFGINSYPSSNKNLIKEIDKEVKKDFSKRHNLFNHAERDAIFKCAKKGVKIDKTTMYSFWAPCFNCCLSIISSGISEFVFHRDFFDKYNELSKKGETSTNWEAELIESLKLLKNQGIEIVRVSGKVGSKGVINSKEYVF